MSIKKRKKRRFDEPRVAEPQPSTASYKTAKTDWMAMRKLGRKDR
jgi:hypothetical protein